MKKLSSIRVKNRESLFPRDFQIFLYTLYTRENSLDNHETERTREKLSWGLILWSIQIIQRLVFFLKSSKILKHLAQNPAQIIPLNFLFSSFF